MQLSHAEWQPENVMTVSFFPTPSHTAGFSALIVKPLVEGRYLVVYVTAFRSTRSLC